MPNATMDLSKVKKWMSLLQRPGVDRIKDNGIHNFTKVVNGDNHLYKESEIDCSPPLYKARTKKGYAHNIFSSYSEAS